MAEATSVWALAAAVFVSIFAGTLAALTEVPGYWTVALFALPFGFSAWYRAARQRRSGRWLTDAAVTLVLAAAAAGLTFGTLNGRAADARSWVVLISIDAGLAWLAVAVWLVALVRDRRPRAGSYDRR